MANASDSDINQIFGNVLKTYRSKLGISQEELAFRADVDRTFVSRLERGVRQPTITTLIGLATALDVSAADLVRDTETAYRRNGSAKHKRKKTAE